MADHLARWTAAGRQSATATVVAVKRSAPRPVGSKMAVAADGAVQGTVSGGCVEGAVVVAAEEVIGGAAPRLLHFGVADEEAWELGLPCGGELSVWVDGVEGAPMERFGALARTGGRGALITRLDDGAKLSVDADGTRLGSLGAPALDERGVIAADELMWAERSAQREVQGVPLFVDVTAPARRLLIVGAVDLARAVCRLARVMGWEPFVIDPRGRFATSERFPEAERVLAMWPAKAFDQLAPIDHVTSIAILTHDPKIDDVALALALRSGAGYVGAMGSRRMLKTRRERLLQAGLTDSELNRLAAPIGLDLGAMTVEETGLSVMAEMVALRRGRTGGRLTDASGRIHEIDG